LVSKRKISFVRNNLSEVSMQLTRRRFIAAGLTAAAGIALGGYGAYRMGQHVGSLEPPKMSKVFIIETSDRKKAIKQIFNKFNSSKFSNAKIGLKANYNSADTFPASTHIDSLRTIIETLKEANASDIVLAERSGMGNTRKVIEDSNLFNLSDELGFQINILDEAPTDSWVEIPHEGLHWLRGFKIAKVFKDSDIVIQTCCLKTHRFGGHFTMSLKNSVGLIAKKDPSGFYDYMAELHTSPYQRLMIAEINRFYKTDLIIMDAIEGFVNGGPDRGQLIKPNLIIGSDDRVAIDAVGIALLRLYGSIPEIMKGRIFNLEQISRAAQLGVGVKSASDIKLIPLDDRTHRISNHIENILQTQG
jgi:uncharacterized protein (DUF362 family)